MFSESLIRQIIVVLVAFPLAFVVCWVGIRFAKQEYKRLRAVAAHIFLWIVACCLLALGILSTALGAVGGYTNDRINDYSNWLLIVSAAIYYGIIPLLLFPGRTKKTDRYVGA